MKNGPYELILAPDTFPGKKYRGKYAYEHTVVYWRHTGIVPAQDEIIHHMNENRRDNRIENLQLMSREIHSSDHVKERIPRIELTCAHCSKVFKRCKSRSHLAPYTTSKNSFCSRKCIGLYNYPTKSKNRNEI